MVTLGDKLFEPVQIALVNVDASDIDKEKDNLVSGNSKVVPHGKESSDSHISPLVVPSLEGEKVVLAGSIGHEDEAHISSVENNFIANEKVHVDKGLMHDTRKITAFPCG